MKIRKVARIQIMNGGFYLVFGYVEFQKCTPLPESREDEKRIDLQIKPYGLAVLPAIFKLGHSRNSVVTQFENLNHIVHSTHKMEHIASIRKPMFLMCLCGSKNISTHQYFQSESLLFIVIIFYTNDRVPS